MGILVHKDTKVIVQGITGKAAAFHTQQMIDYGTQVVAGCVPGRGGETALDRPVFDTMKQAVAATGLVWAPVTSVSTTSGSAVLTLPGIGDLASGRVSMQDVQELDVEDLLGRAPVPPDASPAMRRMPAHFHRRQSSRSELSRATACAGATAPSWSAATDQCRRDERSRTTACARRT